MIQSWRDAATREMFEGRCPRGSAADLCRAARRRLHRLNEIRRLEELGELKGNRLHKLVGDREGQWSISVNDQFRICFVWGEAGPADVEFVDYH